MERIKKRKLKFPCLFGGNDETRRRRSIQSRSPANPTTEQSLFKFEVGKSTSCNENQMKKLLAKGISNGFSAKKRSPSILAKLMGRGRCSSKNVVLNPNTTNVRKNTETVCSMTECKWRGAIESVSEVSSQVKEGFESEHVGLYAYDVSLHALRSGSARESEEITVPSRIIFDQHDRLTHSLSHMSESSLIREATNRMFERWNTTHINEDAGTASKVCTLGDMLSSHAESDNVTGLVGISDIFTSPTGPGAILGDRGMDGQGDRHLISKSRSTSLPPSFNDPNHEMNVCHEDDVDEKVYNEPSNEGRRNFQTDVFNREEDMPLKDLSGPESEDVAFRSDCFESINSRLQDLKRNLRLLTIGSTLVSNKLTLIPKVKHIGQPSPESVSPESAYVAHILQTLETYEATHHPIDPRLFYRLEKFYLEGTVLLKNEKRLFDDYIEQMILRTTKSTVAYPWVNPVKRESQLRSTRLNLEDQIRNVAVEIRKDEDGDFCEVYYDKELEWVQRTNQIDILGKLLAELVLNDLVIEVIDL